MPGQRIQRINEQLKREVSEIVLWEVKDPRVGGVTLTRVLTAPDLTLARVFVQLTGDPAERKETLKGLAAATPFIRVALGQRLELRRVPEIRFEVDRSLEHAMRIEQLLAEAKSDEPGEGGAEGGEAGGGERGDGDGEGDRDEGSTGDGGAVR